MLTAICFNDIQTRGLWEKGKAPAEELLSLTKRTGQLRDQTLRFMGSSKLGEAEEKSAKALLRMSFQEFHLALEGSIPQFPSPQVYFSQMKDEAAKGGGQVYKGFVEYQPAVWEESAIRSVNHDPKNRISVPEIGHRLVRYDFVKGRDSFGVKNGESEPLATAVRKMLFEVRKLEEGIGLNEAAIQRKQAKGEKVLGASAKDVKRVFHQLVGKLSELAAIAAMVKENGLAITTIKG